MRFIKTCLVFLFLANGLMGAEEFGTIRRVFTAQGYDDNDVVQMAAVVAPPPGDGRALKFERMDSEIEFSSRRITLRPVYGPAETSGQGMQTVVFPVGRLPAGKYKVSADPLLPTELRIAVATTKQPDTYLFPRLQNLGITQYRDGRIVLSLFYERRAREELSEIQTHIYSDSILVVPRMRVIDEEMPTNFSGWHRDSLAIPLPEDLPSRTFALLIKGRTSGAGARTKTSDILKIIDLDATHASIPTGVRSLSEGTGNLPASFIEPLVTHTF